MKYFLPGILVNIDWMVRHNYDIITISQTLFKLVSIIQAYFIYLFLRQRESNILFLYLYFALRHFLSQQSGAKYQLDTQHWEEFTVIRISIGQWKTAGKLWPIKFEFSVRDEFCLLLENSKKFLHQPSIPIIHYISSWHEFLSRHEVQNLNLTKSSPQESCWDLSQHSLTLSALWRLSAILQCFTVSRSWISASW